MKDTENNFQTSDYPLATFLYASGCRLLSIIDSPKDYRRKLFVFEQPPDGLLALYQSGKAEINVLALNNAQTQLKILLREKED